MFLGDVSTELRDEIRKAKPSYCVPWDIGKDGCVREATVAYENVSSDDPEDVAKKVFEEENFSNDKNYVASGGQENILPLNPSVTDRVPNFKKVRKKRMPDLENLKISDDWTFNLSVTAHPYSSPQFGSYSTVTVAANAMMCAVQVQTGGATQARAFHLGAGEERDSVVGEVNIMGVVMAKMPLLLRLVICGRDAIRLVILSLMPKYYLL